MSTNDELSQSHCVYYEILVNGASLGVFGHDAVRNMGVSVGFALGSQEIFASGVCEENGEIYFYDWLQQPVEAQDRVEFRRVAFGPSQPPRRKRRMNQPNAQQSVEPDRREDAAPG